MVVGRHPESNKFNYSRVVSELTFWFAAGEALTLRARIALQLADAEVALRCGRLRGRVHALVPRVSSKPHYRYT